MKRIFLVFAVMVAMVAAMAVPAFAAPGGIPSENAKGPDRGFTGNCIVPGTLIREAAQAPGPTQVLGQPPGTVLSAICTPSG